MSDVDEFSKALFLGAIWTVVALPGFAYSYEVLPLPLAVAVAYLITPIIVAIVIGAMYAIGRIALAITRRIPAEWS